MPRAIQNLLDDIMNARYGEQVRTAIHDSIEQCYDDAQSGVTIAEAAASSAVSIATSAASEAVSIANSAASSLSSKLDEINNAWSTYTTTTFPEKLAELESEVDVKLNGDPNDATKKSIDEIVNEKFSAQVTTWQTEKIDVWDNKFTAQDGWNNKFALWESYFTSGVTNNWVDKVGSWASTFGNWTNTFQGVGGWTSQFANLKSDCNAAKDGANEAKLLADIAASRAELAAVAVEGLTVSSENVSADTSAAASVSKDGSHYNIHFKLRQGPMGPPNLVKGSVYTTLDDLEDATASLAPSEGDQYAVGASTPYNIYRWTGTSWLDMGQQSVQGISNSNIDSYWASSSASSEDASRYLNGRGLIYFIHEKVKTALSGKVDKDGNKVLSEVNFTTSMAQTLADHTTLINNKVNKDGDKVLSTYDFDDAAVSLINEHNDIIGFDTMATTASTITGAINELKLSTDGTAASLATAIGDRNLKTYTSVTQLNLVSGSATIAAAYSALSLNSMLVAAASEFASAQVPATTGVIKIIKGSAASIAIIQYYAKENGGLSRCMYLDSSNVPTGTWLNRSGFTVSNLVKDNVSVNASNVTTVEISCANQTGLEPLGIVGYTIQNASSSGVGSSFACLYDCFISNADPTNIIAKASIRNYTTSAIKVKVTLKVLWY